MKFFVTALFLISAMMGSLEAATSEEVLIRGKIGSAFDDKQVSVIDSLGQSYKLPRKLFPANFVFKQGKTFSIEVDEKHLEKIKVTQPL